MLKENIKELRKRKGYLQEQLALRLIVAAFLLFLGAIYDDWTQMFYEFGQNLYHILNK